MVLGAILARTCGEICVAYKDVLRLSSANTYIQPTQFVAEIVLQNQTVGGVQLLQLTIF